MHEKFDAEMERQARRLDNRIFEPPVVTCLNDIKRLLVELDPVRPTSGRKTISAEMVAEDDDGNMSPYRVTAAPDEISKRDMLLHGMGVVKSMMALHERAVADAQPVLVNGREMKPAAGHGPGSAGMAVDRLIKRLLNAKRQGLLIVWSVTEGAFAYDIFEHRLFRMK